MELHQIEFATKGATPPSLHPFKYILTTMQAELFEINYQIIKAILQDFLRILRFNLLSKVYLHHILSIWLEIRFRQPTSKT